MEDRFTTSSEMENSEAKKTEQEITQSVFALRKLLEKGSILGVPNAQFILTTLDGIKPLCSNLIPKESELSENPISPTETQVIYREKTIETGTRALPGDSEVAQEIKADKKPFWMNPDIIPVVVVNKLLDSGGATADVYEAQVAGANHSPAKAAIKIPRLGGVGNYSKEEGREHILLEQKQLEKLRAKQEELFPGTPSHFVSSRLTEVNGTTCLLMELIPQENGVGKYSLSGEYYKNQGVQPPELSPEKALHLLGQALEVVAIAHSAGIYGIDRKGGDYHYFPENNRLVVLDWNVSKNSQGEAKTEDHVMGDIQRTFSELKYINRYLSPKARDNFELIRNRLANPRCTITAEKAQELIKNIDSIAEQDVTTAIPETKSVDVWRDVLAEPINKITGGYGRLLSALKGMAQNGSTISFDAVKRDTQVDRADPSKLPYVDLALFLSDLDETLTFKPSLQADENYGKDWKKELGQDTLLLLTGVDTSRQVKERLKSKLEQLRSNNYLQANYFRQGHTPFPQEIIKLLD